MSLKDKAFEDLNELEYDSNFKNPKGELIFKYEDVKEAVLEFEERFYNRNKIRNKDNNKKIMVLFKEIFGDFEHGRNK